jgi:uncharacterized phage protein gp47/JayE
MSSSTQDRPFAVIPVGGFRVQILLQWSTFLRSSVNPETGAAFTEAEIRRATAKGGRWWIDAEAIDQVAQVSQAQAAWLADQILPETASTSWIEAHARQWLDHPELLEATGSVGTVTAVAPAGTTFEGSSTPEDVTAHYALDAQGRRYQVLADVVTPSNGLATLSLFAIDPGDETNIEIGDVLTWGFGPAGAEPPTITVNFIQGTDRETDAERARRVADTIRHKPAAGNWAHFRAWARDAANWVEDAFTYPCALYAGSVLVSPLAKRAGASGPTARIPADVSDVVAYLTPPDSTVMAGDPLVLVVAPTSEPVTMYIGILMPVSTSAGWADPTPWPGYTATRSTIQTLTTQTSFRINSTTSLPSSYVPRIMAWNITASRWVELDVDTITAAGGSNYDVVLNAAPSFTLAAGDPISPFTELHDLIAEAAEAYFDSLGPGEVVAATDPRIGRAFRSPKGNETKPSRAGAAILGWLTDALGVVADHAELDTVSTTTPTVPGAAELGPRLLTLGDLGIYAIT